MYSSYLGGNTYKAGQYLRKYWGEDNAPFDAYAARLDVTPLDNHVKTTIDIYRSYLWRSSPNRTFGTLAGNPFVESYIEDTDYDGQGLDSFMKTAMDWAMALGHVWIGMDRPDIAANNAADEIEQGIYAYAAMYTPQMVTDWKYEKAGPRKQLTYLKVIEATYGDVQHLKLWYTDRVETYTVRYDETTKEYDKIIDADVVPNELGKVPFFALIPQKSPVTGMGESILNDVADVQRSIYNKLSELEQTIRLSGHPSLVKTAQTKVTGGAGGIVTIPEDLEPGLYPSLLQPSGSVESILNAIKHDIDAINGMTHLGAIRAVKGSVMSGDAISKERELLNSKLSDLADIAEEAEYKMWNLWFEWMDIAEPEDFLIEYIKTFDTQDPSYQTSLWQKALETIDNPVFVTHAHKEIAKLLVTDEVVLNEILNSMNTPVTPILQQDDDNDLENDTPASN
jgi:hypothetical protein